ncbi:MAG: efflux RND transporter periplasmic adaptor subunit [Candidatus Marinimicrobia bacterium]|nr:efflux RND transporter periplasmic adaptor subunit [Candidatus Neomarinimicrobiota bacterium]
MKAGIKKITGLIKKYKIHFSIGIAVFIILLAILPPRIKKIVAGPMGEYETTTVKTTDLIQSVSASGEVASQEQVTLKFQTSGLLVWLGVKEGDQVQKWQGIASLDQRQLEMTLKKELNDYMNERWDFDQTREDYQITNDNLSKYTLTNEIRRILEKAQFDLNNTIIDVEIADLAKKLATLSSPIEGIVTEIEPAVAGINVTPTSAYFTIANPGLMKFVADIDESDIGKIALGQKVILTLDAYPEEEFEGEITHIAFAAMTTSGGGTAFSVDITLPENLETKFKVGMNGDTEIITAEKSEVISVPTEALKIKDGVTYIQIIEGRSLKEVEVKTGLESETQVEIISGLNEGQLVVTGKKK